MSYWFQTIELMSVPIICLSIYTAALFARMRKKQGYKIIGIGNCILLASVLLNWVLWSDSGQNHRSEVWLQSVHDILFNVGWYFCLLGIFQLHRTLAKRGRIVFFGASIIFVISTFLPSWLENMLFGVVVIVVSFKIRRWMAHSNKIMEWLLRFLAVSKIVAGATSLPLKGLNLMLDGWSQAVFLIVGICLTQIIVVGRVSDVLSDSYRSSITDALTGLYNRRYFYGAIQKYINRSSEVSVIFFDLDNFKKLNDTQGHKAGDDTLKLVASILKDESDGKGIAGRYGGEEMVVLIAQADINIEDFAERIRQRIERETIVTASVGFASWVAGLSPEELLKRADEAMYHSKTTGKNKVTGFRS